MSGIVYDPYAKVPIEQFLPELTFDIPELPDEIAMHYIRKAAIEFAQRSRVIRRKVRIRTQNCVNNYILEAPDCMELVAIHTLCNVSGGCCGTPSRVTHEPCNIRSCGVTSWYEAPNIIWISPGRDCTEYEVEISVAPPPDACELDKEFYTKYQEALLVGAKTFVYGLSRKDWSSQPLSDAMRLEFDRRIAAATLDKLMGGQVGAIKAKSRRVV